MIGFYWGKSRWGDIPQALGLSVEEGILKGLWRGGPGQAYFHNERVQRYGNQDDYYEHYTKLSATLDPPLLMGASRETRCPWLEGEHKARVFDNRFVAELGAPMKAAALDW